MEENQNINTDNKSTGVMGEVIQWINAVLLALLIALVIRGFIFEPVMVKGDSMQDTLSDSQRLIVYKLGNFFSLPKKGEIIVFQNQAGFFQNLTILDEIPVFRKAFPDFRETNYIKRAIALPGDTVDIRGGSVYVNGEKLDEPYIKGDTNAIGMTFPVKVPENKVFVLGDNRQNSSDSRMIGFISTNKIKGRAVLRIYPFEEFGTLK